MSDPELLPPADYAQLEPVLATSPGHHVELAVESTKDWTRVWAVRDPTTQHVLALVLTWWTQGQVELVHLATLPGARRRGLARRLMLHLIDKLRHSGGASLWLEVRPSNLPARALYDALGFSVSRERKRYYADGEDALEMVLEVAAP